MYKDKNNEDQVEEEDERGYFERNWNEGIGGNSNQRIFRGGSVKRTKFDFQFLSISVMEYGMLASSSILLLYIGLITLKSGSPLGSTSGKFKASGRGEIK